ncbi:hypothetical protein S40288_04984 [Stachybotrys chartarum IBT 40288]|nr:hypothetical protein S40288_04984 [Stachybotrys chartarum IBT 40288]
MGSSDPNIISPVAEPDAAGQDHGILEKLDSPTEQPTPSPPYTVFARWEKHVIVLAASVTAFFSPLSAQIYLPALTPIAEDLHVTNAQVNLTITTYMILQGIVPMFIGSLADSGGRRPAYVICFVIYIAANIGLAVAPNYAAVLGLRCLQSAGSSSTIALCSAVVADIITSAERGQYVGYTVMPVVLAPALGPVIGGALSQTLGWRSIFWFLAILAGVTLALIFVFFPETCREIVDDGSITPPRLYRSVWQLFQRRHQRQNTELSQSVSNVSKENVFKFKPPNVLDSLLMILEKGTGIILGVSAITFAGFYCISTAMPELFTARYGYSEIEVGLMYLPLAVGSIGSAIIVGPLMNRNHRRHCVKLDIPLDKGRQQDLTDFPIERARLEIGMPLLAITGAALIAWGWAMHANAHVAVLCVLSGIMGISFVGFNNTTNVLLVDMHPGKPGTAIAANGFTRCLLGAGATAVIAPMIDGMGVGWAFTLLGALYYLCLFPTLFVMTKGIRWRRELAQKIEKKKERASQSQDA